MNIFMIDYSYLEAETWTLTVTTDLLRGRIFLAPQELGHCSLLVTIVLELEAQPGRQHMLIKWVNRKVQNGTSWQVIKKRTLLPCKTPPR